MKNISGIEDILASASVSVTDVRAPYPEELYITVKEEDFLISCVTLHKHLDSPVMALFAEDERKISGKFNLYCLFLDRIGKRWVFLCRNVRADKEEFESMAKSVYSANLFEREIKEMFGLEPSGNPDMRSLRLHDEVWPRDHHPLRKDFLVSEEAGPVEGKYVFKRVEGEGVFEIPVGPVHAGVIGPGHFRFSVAGEPVINMETRLGWTHRGIEKLLEGKDVHEALKIFECISGDTAFAYGLAFCRSVEKISKIEVPLRAQVLRVFFLEIERIYNHVNDIGGMALDVGFSFPAQFASLIKEDILRLNKDICGSRYLKGINGIGGTNQDIDRNNIISIHSKLEKFEKDLSELESI
ncbi:MAG TPA: NADH-quinone oxidoreductase subunit C, partial [Candidatus Omnitrophota bacterium]|nr:NADH-quinone oxidoreductase subunit C [Candidatus Omnitrophota bacterium]